MTAAPKFIYSHNLDINPRQGVSLLCVASRLRRFATFLRTASSLSLSPSKYWFQLSSCGYSHADWDTINNVSWVAPWTD